MASLSKGTGWLKSRFHTTRGLGPVMPHNPGKPGPPITAASTKVLPRRPESWGSYQSVSG
jgi:hypothetical protein